MANKRVKKKGNPEGGKGTRRRRKDRDLDQAEATERSDDKTSEDQSWGAVLTEWVKSLLFALILFLVITTFIIKTYVIISGSMEETLLVGDLLLANRAAVGSRVPGTSIRVPGYADPQRGQVFVIDPPHEEEMMLVKRLMGLPGDTLEMRDKVLFVNGEALDEPYVRFVDPGDHTDPSMGWQEAILLRGPSDPPYGPTRDNWGPLVIPPNQYFMLGDNRDESLDSRYWGLLDDWRLVGRVMLVYFSYNKDSFRPFPWIREIRWGRIGDIVR